MAGAAPKIEGDSSNFARPQRVIECSPTVLQQIRAVVLERFNRAPHGGDELTGVLFGSHQDREVRITAFRPLPDGAGNNGRDAYASLIETCSRTSGDRVDLAGLEPVGCFRAHPRSNLVLSKQDLAIYDSLFTEPWQVAMIVRPGNLAASRIRIFFRDADGTLRAEGGFRELMQAAFEQRQSDVEETEGVSTAPEVELAREVFEQSPDLDQSPDQVMQQAADQALAEALGHAPEAGIDVASDGQAQVADQRAHVAEDAAAGLRRRKRIGVGTIIWPSFVIAAVLVSAALWMSRPQQLALRVLDDGGQLRISWDQNARAVQRGEGGRIEITDGNNKLWLELDRDQLRKANVTYPARSNSVTVRLVVPQRGGEPVEDMARLVGVQAANHRWQPAERPPEVVPPQQPAELVVSVPVEPVTESRPPAASGQIKQSVPPTNALSSEARNRPVASVATTPHTDPAPARTAANGNGPITSSTSSVEGSGSAHAPVTPASAQNGSSQGQAASAVAQNVVHPAASPPATTQTSVPAAQNIAQNSVPPVLAMPSAGQSVAPPVAQNAAPRAPAVVHAAAGPASGRIIWIGRLQKNELLTITGKTATNGSVMGELPGRPVKVSVSPGDLSNDGVVLYTSNLQYANNVVEPPSAENGWNKTVYTWSPRLANDVSMQEAPGAQNEWKRMVLRSKNPKISVIVIEWAVVN